MYLDLPSGEDLQMERRTAGIQRENIDIENVPRHRCKYMYLYITYYIFMFLIFKKEKFLRLFSA